MDGPWDSLEVGRGLLLSLPPGHKILWRYRLLAVKTGAEQGKREQSSRVTAGDAAVAMLVSKLLGKVGSVRAALGRGGGSQASPQAQVQVSVQQEHESCHGN